METGRPLKFDPHSGFGTQIGARVALLRCPVLRLSEDHHGARRCLWQGAAMRIGNLMKTGSVWSDGC
jgi:hypothetical protein